MGFHKGYYDRLTIIFGDFSIRNLHKNDRKNIVSSLVNTNPDLLEQIYQSQV